MSQEQEPSRTKLCKSLQYIFTEMFDKIQKEKYLFTAAFDILLRSENINNSTNYHKQIIYNMKLFNKILRIQAYFSTIQSKDVHNCTHLKLQEKMKNEQFEPYFLKVLQREIQQKSKALWVHLNKQNMGLVSIILNQNFRIHHGKNQTLVLYRWLSPLSDLVPQYSLFYVACGAIVIRNNRVLLVQQKNGARMNDWGIPGGLCQPNEPLSLASERQLKQQTNLSGKFKYMLYFRELQGTLFGGTDFYFANLIEINQGEQKNLQLCQRQLQNYKWLPLDQVQQFFKSHQIRGTQKYLLTYLNQLYEKKYDFYNECPNKLNEYSYPIQGKVKYFKEHKLIEKI